MPKTIAAAPIPIPAPAPPESPLEPAGDEDCARLEVVGLGAGRLLNEDVELVVGRGELDVEEESDELDGVDVEEELDCDSFEDDVWLP